MLIYGNVMYPQDLSKCTNDDIDLCMQIALSKGDVPALELLINERDDRMTFEELWARWLKKYEDG